MTVGVAPTVGSGTGVMALSALVLEGVGVSGCAGWEVSVGPGLASRAGGSVGFVAGAVGAAVLCLPLAVSGEVGVSAGSVALSPHAAMRIRTINPSMRPICLPTDPKWCHLLIVRL